MVVVGSRGNGARGAAKSRKLITRTCDADYWQKVGLSGANKLDLPECNMHLDPIDVYVEWRQLDDAIRR